MLTSIGCSGVCTNLVKTPSNYDNAYFEISYIRVLLQGSGGGGMAGSGTVGADLSNSTSIAGVGTYSVTKAAVLAIVGFGLTLLTV